MVTDVASTLTGTRATWDFDPAHSSIEFRAKHMMVTTVKGRFTGVQGTIIGNVEDPTQAEVDVVIDAASIDTRNDQRDVHLRSADFLDVENFPQITFKSTTIKRVDHNDLKVTGDLTIHGVTKQVTLDVEINGVGKSPFGTEVGGLEARTTISRKDFGLNWNVALETGDYCCLMTSRSRSTSRPSSSNNRSNGPPLGGPDPAGQRSVSNRGRRSSPGTSTPPHRVPRRRIMTTPSPNTHTTSIHPDTTVGLLSLTVSDLTRSLTFYTKALGFEVLEQEDKDATLGAAGTPLLLLYEQAGAAPWPRDRQSYAGLYHFAILMPTRADLGRWLGHWLELGFPLPGQGDHLVSEALYLEDPDGHGIEIYRDRPRDQWQWIDGQVRMAANPVDIQGLLTEAAQSGEPWVGLPVGTTLGHIHLQVGDIAQAESFYHDLLGFDIVARMPTALFISAGGYHHHLGMNTWHSRGAGAAPQSTAGLRFFTIDLPGEDARREVVARIEAAGFRTAQTGDLVVFQDPWHNTILLQVGAASDVPAATALSTAAQSTRSSPAHTRP